MAQRYSRAGVRLLATLAYGVDLTDRDRAQLRATIDRMLSKMASPYMSYVPIINDPSERDGLMKPIVGESGTPVEAGRVMAVAEPFPDDLCGFG